MTNSDRFIDTPPVSKGNLDEQMRKFRANPSPPLIRRVYIAGPITIGDQGANVHRAMAAAHRLMDHGLSPLCPHLTMYLHMMHPRPYKEWIETDLPWLEVSDAVLRLPGESKGSDGEEEKAGEWGIPVFIDEKELYREVGRRLIRARAGPRPDEDIPKEHNEI